jgi:hypothetical protein
MILGGVNWFLRWYRSDGRLTVDEIAGAYIDFIFYGLLAPAALHAAPPPVAAAAVAATPLPKTGADERRRRRGKLTA